MFTESEKKVLNLMAHDHSTKEIAQLLKLSVRTVEAYKHNLKMKSGKKTLTGLMFWAMLCNHITYSNL